MVENKELQEEKLTIDENVEYYKTMMRFSFKLVHYFNDFWKEILKEVNINQTEFVILGVVVDNPKLLQQEVVKIVGIDKSIVSRNMKRLEKKKLLTRTPNTEYNHAYFCEATALGEEVYQKVHEKGDPLIDKNFSVVNRSEIEQVRETLAKVWGHIYEE